jgi:hypothetical protein
MGHAELLEEDAGNRDPLVLGSSQLNPWFRLPP